MTNRLFCFGLGYCAERLVDRMAATGWSVAGTCRGTERRDALAARGIETHLFDRDIEFAPAALTGATHILLSVPPDDLGDPVFDRLGSVLAGLPDLQWLGYLSTTGVYGDRDGAWVSEDDAPAPRTDRAQRRCDAETSWLSLYREHGVPFHVFRLAGIYGPGRSTFDQLRAGTARRIVKPGQVFSRVHVDDIVNVLCRSIDHPAPGAIYNVCDDEPAASADVVAFAATLLGMAPPPEIPIEAAGLSPMGASFYAECRRVRNDRIKRDLGVTLLYPSYREGLQAILESET